MNRLRRAVCQRRHARQHRDSETAGIRLAILDENILPTFIGRRAWCDTLLQECPVPGHDLCCYCTHTNIDPYREATERST